MYFWYAIDGPGALDLCGIRISISGGNKNVFINLLDYSSKCKIIFAYWIDLSCVSVRSSDEQRRIVFMGLQGGDFRYGIVGWCVTFRLTDDAGSFKANTIRDFRRKTFNSIFDIRNYIFNCDATG